MIAVVRPILCLCVALFLISCGLLIDIPDDSGVSTCPGIENQVLSEQEIPHICFDFEVNRYSVEAIFSVREAAGAVPGIYEWEDQTVFFRPCPELIPGRRYTFAFAGTYRDLQGSEYATHRIVPFYYKQRDESVPYLVSSNPLPGQIISMDAGIRIEFSEAMDPCSAVHGIRIEPDTPVTMVWEKAATEVVLAPQEKWEPCRCYTIRITEELLGETGIPLAETRELIFWIQEDIESPRILLVEPALNQPAALYPWTGYGMDQPLGLQDVVRIRFTEAMDTGSTADALTLVPAEAEERIWVDAATLVVIPAAGFSPGTEYLLQFNAQAKDRAGNTLSMSEPIRFTVIPGEITAVTEFVQDGIQVSPGDYSTATAIEIQPYPISSSGDYELLFRFTGCEFDSNTEKYAVQEAISLLCIFPDSGVPDPIATGYSWMGDLVLGVTYSELQSSTADQRIYYLLRIRGGPSGIATEEGYRLQRDLEQLVLTAEQ